MNQSFEIKFDFAEPHSDWIIPVKATAELHHSDPYYVVNDFHLTTCAATTNDLSIIPAQEIKQISRGSSKVWVHRDSERESSLSLAIGKGIEKVLKDRENNG